MNQLNEPKPKQTQHHLKLLRSFVVHITIKDRTQTLGELSPILPGGGADSELFFA